jgi:hypothetical protein
MSLIVTALRWIISHPLIAGGGLLAVIIALAVVPSLFSSDQEPEQPAVINPGQPAITDPGSEVPVVVEEGEESMPQGQEEDPKSGPRIKPAPDPHDYDPAVRQEIQRQLTEQPAVQHMPLKTARVSADIDDILPDGRLLIIVKYQKNKQQGQKEWRKFLQRHKDPGGNYVVVYQRG